MIVSLEVDGGGWVLRGTMASSRLDGEEDETSWDVELPISTCALELPGGCRAQKVERFGLTRRLGKRLGC